MIVVYDSHQLVPVARKVHTVAYGSPWGWSGLIRDEFGVIKWYKMVQVNPEKLAAHHLWVLQYEVYNYVQLSSIKLIMNVLLTLFWLLQGAYLQRPKIHISLKFGIPVCIQMGPINRPKTANLASQNPDKASPAKKDRFASFFYRIARISKYAERQMVAAPSFWRYCDMDRVAFFKML